MARLLLCLGMAFMLTISSAAAAAHGLTHLRHHGLAAPAGQGSDAPDQDKHDGGHDHMLSLSVPVAALFDETRIEHPPILAVAPVATAPPALILRAADPPPADPPRTV